MADNNSDKDVDLERRLPQKERLFSCRGYVSDFREGEYLEATFQLVDGQIQKRIFTDYTKFSEGGACFVPAPFIYEIFREGDQVYDKVHYQKPTDSERIDVSHIDLSVFDQFHPPEE